MGVICHFGICLKDGISRDFCAVLRICEPAEEFGIFTFRFCGERELFSIDLLGRFRATVAQIPRHDVGICGKLRVKRLAGSHGADRGVALAIRFCGVPAFEAVTFFDRERCGSGRLGVRLNGFAIRCFTVNGAAVCACVPCNSHGNCCAAVVTLAVAVRIYMIGVFISGCFADGTGFGSLVLGIAYARPLAIGVSMVGVVIVAGGASRAGFRASVLAITVI